MDVANIAFAQFLDSLAAGKFPFVITEVRLPRDSVKLGQGGFFGEMALLDRLPRSATIVTTQPTTLLVLYASDFYAIASHIPSLVAAVEKEARRRRIENEGASGQSSK